MATILDSIGKKKGAQFATFTYKKKETGEIAKYNVILGASTHTLYKKDVPVLERLTKLLRAIKAQDHVIKAADELLASRRQSLQKGIGNNDAYTQADTYDYVAGLEGVRVHKETGDIYVACLVNRKEVITAGAPYKKVNSAPKTIAKNRIKYMIPSGRFRTFALDNVTRAALNGDVLVFTTALDNEEEQQ